MSLNPSFKQKWKTILLTNIIPPKQSQKTIHLPKRILQDPQVVRVVRLQKPGKNKSWSTFPRFDFFLDKYKAKSTTPATTKQREWTRANSKTNEIWDKSLYELTNWTNGNSVMNSNMTTVSTGMERVNTNLCKAPEMSWVKSNNNDSRTLWNKKDESWDWDKIRNISRNNSSKFNKIILNIHAPSSPHRRNKESHLQKEIDTFKTKIQSGKEENKGNNNYLSFALFKGRNNKTGDYSKQALIATGGYIRTHDIANRTGAQGKTPLKINCVRSDYTRMARSKWVNYNDNPNNKSVLHTRDVKGRPYQTQNNKWSNMSFISKARRNDTSSFLGDSNERKDLKGKRFELNLNY